MLLRGGGIGIGALRRIPIRSPKLTAHQTQEHQKQSRNELCCVSGVRLLRASRITHCTIDRSLPRLRRPKISGAGCWEEMMNEILSDCCAAQSRLRYCGRGGRLRVRQACWQRIGGVSPSRDKG
jgi:hypothetical protein